MILDFVVSCGVKKVKERCLIYLIVIFLFEQNVSDYLRLVNICFLCILVVVIGVRNIGYVKILLNINRGSCSLGKSI